MKSFILSEMQELNKCILKIMEKDDLFSKMNRTELEFYLSLALELTKYRTVLFGELNVYSSSTKTASKECGEVMLLYRENHFELSHSIGIMEEWMQVARTKEQMAAKNLTYWELEKRTKIPYQEIEYIINHEKRDIDYEKAKSLARELEVPISWLYPSWD